MRKAVASFLAGVAFTLTGVALALPHCPAEDSCKADYFRQAWHIIETKD